MIASRRINYVLFDLGNTLFYFQGSWNAVLKEAYRAVANTLKVMGYIQDEGRFTQRFTHHMGIYSREREVTYIEQTSLMILRRTLLEFYPQPVPIEDMRLAINALYAISEKYWFIEEDTQPLLEKLKAQGYRLGLVSNAADAQDVNNLVTCGNLRPFFDQVIISAEFGLRKPHPKIFRKALSFWQARPEETVMVGDTLNADIAGAQGLKIPAVWITRRVDISTSRRDYPAIDPDASIRALAELPDVLQKWG